VSGVKKLTPVKFSNKTLSKNCSILFRLGGKWYSKN